MGNICQKTYEIVNSFGENAKIVKCPYCKNKVWRRDKTKLYIQLYGCITCSLKNKEDQRYNLKPVRKCRGRYDDDDDDINNINFFNNKLRSKYYFKPINYKLSR